MTKEQAIRVLKGDTLYNSRELKAAKEIAIDAIETTIRLDRLMSAYKADKEG